MRVTPEMETLGSFFVAAPTNPEFMQTDPAITFNGENYLVVWADEKFGVPNVFDPVVARVTPGGVALDTGNFVAPNPGFGAYRPNVAWGGPRGLVVWYSSGSGIFGRFVNRDGLPEGDLIPIASGASGVDLAYGAGNYLLVWFVGTYPVLNIMCQLISPAGELIGEPRALTADADCHRWADVAFDGTDFLVVWQGGLNSAPNTIWGQFIAPDGSCAGDTFRICDATAYQRWWPAIAVSEEKFLVAWGQGTSSDVYGNADVPVTGIAERLGPEPNRSNSSEGVPRAGFPAVYDALGRRVKASRLRPGVYVRGPGQATKIVTLR